MTSKEKAIELVDKFKLSFAGVISNDEDWETLAKQCALIAVDEIQNVISLQKTTLTITAYRTMDCFNHDIEYNEYLRREIIFYFDFVKQEIENL
jgi:DNA-binding transcriptional regulator LsrR (DeoR family)